MTTKYCHYKTHRIVLILQRTDKEKWLCRATVKETEWLPIDEIGDTKTTARKNALDKAKELIDQTMRFCGRLRGE
jgi:uncharacterized protein YqfB (UPF0267 family)